MLSLVQMSEYLFRFSSLAGVPAVSRFLGLADVSEATSPWLVEEVVELKSILPLAESP